MKFSVLMSVYSKENPLFFDSSVNSILSEQSVIPDELVLVCDGPLTAELDSVIGKYQKQFPEIMKVYRLEKNAGLGNALNYGLSKCTYDIVARADSDDICAYDRFEKQISFLECNEDIDIIGSDIDEFEEDYHKPVSYKEMPSDHDEIKRMCKFRNPMNHVTVMFRKKTILECGSYIHLKYLEDYYLWVRAFCNGGKFANINKPLVHVRIGNGMVNRRSDKSYIAGWKELSLYMLKNRMINKMEYYRNILSVSLFVYMPVGIKKLLYKTILRKNKIEN